MKPGQGDQLALSLYEVAIRREMQILKAEFSATLNACQEWRGKGMYPCFMNVADRLPKYDRALLFQAFFNVCLSAGEL